MISDENGPLLGAAITLKGSNVGTISDEEGMYIMNYMLLGFFKSAGNVLKEQLGIKALKRKIADNLIVGPRHIQLGKTEPDGVDNREGQYEKIYGEQAQGRVQGRSCHNGDQFSQSGQ